MKQRVSINLRFLSFTAATILGAAQGTTDLPESSAHSWIAAGLDAQRAAKLAQARIFFEKALRIDPRSPEANLRLGLLLNRSGYVAAARDAFRVVVQVDPQRPEGHLNLGLTLIGENVGKRDWPAAMSEFKEAIRLRPTFGEAHRFLALAFAQEGNREQSIAEFHLALKSLAASPECRLEFAKALDEAGHLEESQREYREVLRLQPDNADAQLGLGQMLARNAASVEAIDCLRRAVAKNPDHAAAQYALAKTLQRAGRLPEAAVAFRAAASATKHQENAVQCTRLSNEGLDAARRGDNKAAADALRRAVELRPDAAIPHYNLALILADAGDLVGAKLQARLAISLAPMESRFYIALARICRETGDQFYEKLALKQAVALDPGNAASNNGPGEPAPDASLILPNESYFFGASADTSDGHFAFATILTRQGDWTGAIGEWLRSLALKADSVDARNNLAITYARAGRYDEAELEFYKSLQTSPSSAPAHFGLAVLDLEQGKPGAIEELQEVMRLQPEYPQAQNLLRAALAHNKPDITTGTKKP